MHPDRPRRDARDVAAHLVLAQDAGLDLRRERAELPLGRAAGAATGAGEAVPRAGEAAEVGTAAAPVRREHRADAAAAVAIGAYDDAVVAPEALEHRDPRLVGQAVDDVPKPVRVPAIPSAHHRLRQPPLDKLLPLAGRAGKS